MCYWKGVYRSQLLNHYIVEKKFTLPELNHRILIFPYTNLDARNKPTPLTLKQITTGTLKQSASQMWTLGRLLPFLIGDMVDMSSGHWQCFILLLEILSTVTSPSIGHEEVSHLKLLISFYLGLFKTLFPERPLIPKQHYHPN